MGTAYEFETFILEKFWSLCYAKRSHADFLGVEIHKLSYEEEKKQYTHTFAVKTKKECVQLSKYQKGIEQLKL